MRWFWIDRFTEFVSGSHARGIKNVTLDQEVVDEYCPGFPFFPSTLIIEGIAQLGGILVAEHFDWDKRVVLAKIGNAKFHRQATPGDRMDYWVRLEGTQEHGARVTATSQIDGQPHAEIDLMFAFLEAGRFAEGSLFHSGDLAEMLRIMKLFDCGIGRDGQPLGVSDKL
ncbi:MAG: beta-hydroxyacyl-ACP dehydratase [Planctomycetaceae bacterium]|jgi:3-hydroxyacyl-[acyl-carrier-protein] dehydratase|nr:MAG: beta-hydroxyacyl-ACP dehydratase [Planctomycetaceae bacterium]